jgi:hypothetical protein
VVSPVFHMSKYRMTLVPAGPLTIDVPPLSDADGIDWVDHPA